MNTPWITTIKIALLSLLVAQVAPGNVTLAQGAASLQTPAKLGRTFYIAPNGNDTWSGQSSARAWKTLAPIKKVDFQPGDRLLLKGGVTYKGSIVLDDKDAGTPERPVILSSYGAGRATIASGDATALSVTAGGIEIRQLNFKGNWTHRIGEKPEEGRRAGIVFRAGTNAAIEHHHVRIEDVGLSGFTGAGITMASEKGNPCGFSDVRIARVMAQDNGGGGIVTWDDSNDRSHGYAHHKLLITDCDTSRNATGSGIVISGFDGGIIEYCRSSDNVGKGGGVGIWAWGTKNVVFRYCIASGTRSGGGDGGGFDLDGSCDGCVVENCLTYENDGPGYMHCDYPWASRTAGNIIRNSISINDGRKKRGENIGFGFVTWGPGIDDCHIVNNIAVVTKADAQRRNHGVFFVSYILGSQQPKEVPHVRSSTFRNNIAIISGQGVAFVRNGLPDPTVADVKFEGNYYGAAAGLQPAFFEGKGGKTKYSTLEAWRSATGQETAKGSSTVRTTKPTVPEVTEKAYQSVTPRKLPQFPLMKILPVPGKVNAAIK